MPVALTVPIEGGEELLVPYEPNSVTFVVGANGTGKSALMVRFKIALGEAGHRIVAARPLVLQADAPEIPAAQAVNQRRTIGSWDSDPQYRAKMVGGTERAQMYLHTLTELESAFQREMRAAFEAVDLQSNPEGAIPDPAIACLRELQASKSPLSKINQALLVSGFLIELKITADGQVKASKRQGEEYGVSQTSDGERAALILLIEAMAADGQQILLIDEPERHIHRSLLHPLLLEVMRLRSDCSFIVSTHDIEFVSNFTGPVVLLRDMVRLNESWVADLVSNTSVIDDTIREDILGGRRKLLFVEGTQEGPDERLYNLLFEDVSVSAKGSSRTVIEATRGSRQIVEFAWLRAWGIVDRDGRTDDEVGRLRGQGVWPLPLYSVESIYYHPEVIGHLIDSSIAPKDGRSVNEALAVACRAARLQLPRLAGRSVEKSIRQSVIKSIPKWDAFHDTDQIVLNTRPKEMYDAELAALSAAIDQSDWSTIVSRCPIHETGARSEIAKFLGFDNRVEYEDAVRESLATDDGFRLNVRDVLGEPLEGLAYN